MTVIKFPGHRWAHCPPGCEGCCICAGGLAFCEVCLGAEATLPENCPGRRLTDEEATAIMEGLLDYRRSQGGWTTWTKWDEARARSLLT